MQHFENAHAREKGFYACACLSSSQNQTATFWPGFYSTAFLAFPVVLYTWKLFSKRSHLHAELFQNDDWKQNRNVVNVWVGFIPVVVVMLERNSKALGIVITVRKWPCCHSLGSNILLQTISHFSITVFLSSSNHERQGNGKNVSQTKTDHRGTTFVKASNKVRVTKENQH